MTSAAVHQRGHLEDDQYALRRHRRGREEGVSALVATDDEGQRALPRRLEAQPTAQLSSRFAGGGAALGTRGRTGEERGAEAGSGANWWSGSREKIVHRYTAKLPPAGRIGGRVTRRRPASAATRWAIFARASTKTARSAKSSSICTRKRGLPQHRRTASAIAVTPRLQHGVLLEEYIDAFLFTCFRAETPGTPRQLRTSR